MLFVLFTSYLILLCYWIKIKNLEIVIIQINGVFFVISSQLKKPTLQQLRNLISHHRPVANFYKLLLRANY